MMPYFLNIFSNDNCYILLIRIHATGSNCSQCTSLWSQYNERSNYDSDWFFDEYHVCLFHKCLDSFHWRIFLQWTIRRHSRLGYTRTKLQLNMQLIVIYSKWLVIFVYWNSNKPFSNCQLVSTLSTLVLQGGP